MSENSGRNVKINSAQLRADLEKVKTDNKLYFLICVAMVVVLFITSLMLVLFNLEKPNIVTLVMTVSGASIGGLIFFMVKLWREKSNTEVVLALAINMKDDATLRRVIEILAARLPS